jgi:hypothetical protein
MLPLAFALLVAAAISFAFRTTRGIGVLCAALFTFLFPWFTAGLLGLALAGFLLLRIR